MSKFLKNDKWKGIWNCPKYEEYRKKIVDSFADLVFDEAPHKYYLNGVEIECVSNVTHMFKEEFDADKKSVEVFERHYDNPLSKYFHMTPEQIREAWVLNAKNACEHGTERHEFGESCFYFMTEQYDKILPAFKDRLVKDDDGNYLFKAIHPKEEATVDYWNAIPKCIVPILSETKVYDEELGYSGTFDILFFYDAEIDGKNAEKSGFYIMDYKTNKDLYKNFNKQKLLPPFNELLDMPLSLYKLQLSLYQNCLEKIGMKVVARSLIWLLPDATFKKIGLEEYVEPLKKELKTRKKQQVL